MVRPFRVIVFTQPLAQAMGLHAHDGVALLIEIGRPPEGVYPDVVLLDLLRSALEVLVANVDEQLREIRRAMKYTGGQNCFQFMFFLRTIGG